MHAFSPVFNFEGAQLFIGIFGGSDGQESARNVGDPGLDPWVEKIPWRREWLPIPVFLSGEFHGQRSLVDYNLWSHKE